MKTLIYGFTGSGKSMLAAGMVTEIMNKSDDKTLVILGHYFTESFFKNIKRKEDVISILPANMVKTLKKIWEEKTNVILLLDLEHAENLKEVVPYLDLFEDVIITAPMVQRFRSVEIANEEISQNRYNIRFDNVVRTINKLELGEMESGILYDMIKGTDIEFCQVSEIEIERKVE